MSVQMRSRLFIDIAYEAMACSTPDMIPGVILMLESHLRNNRREGKVMCFHEKWDAFGHCLSKCKVNFWGHRVKRLPLLLAFELICMAVRVYILSIIKGQRLKDIRCSSGHLLLLLYQTLHGSTVFRKFSLKVPDDIGPSLCHLLCRRP